MNEREAIRRLKRGDIQGLESLVKRYTLTTLSVTPAGTSITVCYDLPAGFYDWWPHTEVLVDGEQGLPLGGGDLAGKTDTSGMTQRCIRSDYSTPFNPDARQVVITVDRLQVSPSESLSDAVIERAHQRLAEQGIEVAFRFGDHGMGWEVLRAPEGMDEAVVGQAVWDALAEHHPGPWVFTVNLP